MPSAVVSPPPLQGFPTEGMAPPHPSSASKCGHDDRRYLLSCKITRPSLLAVVIIPSWLCLIACCTVGIHIMARLDIIPSFRLRQGERFNDLVSSNPRPYKANHLSEQAVSCLAYQPEHQLCASLKDGSCTSPSGVAPHYDRSLWSLCTTSVSLEPQRPAYMYSLRGKEQQHRRCAHHTDSVQKLRPRW